MSKTNPTQLAHVIHIIMVYLGMSAYGTSTNTPNGRVIFRGVQRITNLSCMRSRMPRGAQYGKILG